MALTIQDAALEGSRQDVGRARSPLLPQINTKLDYNDADPRTLEGSSPIGGRAWGCSCVR